MHEPIASINLAALTHNITRLKTYLADDTQILVAVKADGYGHGAVQVSKHLESIGVSWFGVATKGEALELRQGGVTGRILMFSPVYEGDGRELDAVVDADIDFTVVDTHSVEVVSRAAARVSKRARVHLKVDTGMGRLGYLPDVAIQVARQVDDDANLELTGVWTHFACADDADPAYTNMQLSHFHNMLDLLNQDGIEIPIKHTANSSALIAKPESHFDMVRPGIAAYGYHSSSFIAGIEPHLKPVMTVKAPVTFVKPFAAGRHISYSSLWQAPEDTTIATVRIGYADGYPRLLSNKGYVHANDQTFPIRGRVCMDQLMIEVGSDDVQVGDAITMFGEGLDAETLAGLYGSISYDLLVSVGKRVARDYIHQPLPEDVSASA